MDDHSEPRPRPAKTTSRRAILAAVAGGAAATAASMALRVSPVSAADGDPLIVGQANTATSGTSLQASIAMANVFAVANNDATGPNSAIHCASTTGTGIEAYTMSGTAVYADSMGPGRAVRGGSFGPGGVGIYGEAAGGATALQGFADTGYGLFVTGKVRFASRSGRQAVSAGKTFYRRSLSGVTTSSIVIAVLQTVETGTWVRAAVPSTGKFTIYFNRALPSSAVVGWLVLN